MREKNSLPKLVQLWKRIELETLTCLFPLQLLTTQCKIHPSCANRLSLYLSYPEKQIPLTELVFKLSSCAGQPDLMFPFYLLFESLVKLICGMWVSLTLLLHLSIAPPSRLPLNWMSCNGVTKKKLRVKQISGTAVAKEPEPWCWNSFPPGHYWIKWIFNGNPLNLWSLLLILVFFKT